MSVAISGEKSKNVSFHVCRKNGGLDFGTAK